MIDGLSVLLFVRLSSMHGRRRPCGHATACGPAPLVAARAWPGGGLDMAWLGATTASARDNVHGSLVGQRPRRGLAHGVCGTAGVWLAAVARMAFNEWKIQNLRYWAISCGSVYHLTVTCDGNGIEGMENIKQWL